MISRCSVVAAVLIALTMMGWVVDVTATNEASVTIRACILPAVVVTTPVHIDNWDIQTGNNSRIDKINVKANTDWEVSVISEISDDDAHFHTPLHVIAPGYSTDVEVGGKGPRVIAWGAPTQEEGVDVELIFLQQVLRADELPAPSENYSVMVDFVGRPLDGC